MAISPLVEQAISVLRGNDNGIFTRPAPHQYPHQWNWDSALIALGLSHFDLPRAQLEIRSLLRGQWRDGMLPHIVYHDAASDYFPSPAFWQIEQSRNAPDTPTSGLTQPPLLTTMLRRIHERHPMLDFVAETYPALLAWHRWLHTARDADGSGLACILHPWESGTDDSPRWLGLLHAMRPQAVPEFRRGDTRYVPTPERPLRSDYERFMYLVDVLRRLRYTPADLLAHSPFLVQDVLFNTILLRADEDLRALAKGLAQPVDEIDGWLGRMRQSFAARFWDESAGLYYDYDLRAGTPIRTNTAATFLPLFAGLASAEQARRLVAEHLLERAEYAPDGLLHYWVTTTARGETAWEARRYWRGPIWIIMNWFLIEGLWGYGYDELAAAVRRDTLALVEGAGFREYYDPRDGSGCGSSDFSWSAALTVELLAT
jgi:glycogen debranching enzyme